MRGYVTQKKSNLKWYPVIYLGKNELTDKREYKWGKACDTKRQAEDALVDLLVMYKTGQKEANVHQVKLKMTLRDVFEEWKPICKGEELYSSEESYNTAMGNIENHVLSVIGDAIVDRIGTQHIRQCFAMMKNKRKDGDGKPLSNATKKKVMGTLNHLFEYAIECGWCESNPCEGVKIKTPDIPPKTIWVIDDINYFLEWAYEHRAYHYYLAWLILATTAMRRGEVGEIRYQDLHDSGAVSITRATTVGRTVKDIKTGSKGRRTVNIFDMVMDAIEVQKDRQREICKKLLNKSGIQIEPKPWDYIITDDHNNPVPLQYLSREFKKAIEEINDSGEHYLMPMPMKNLRHCFATHGLANGVNTPDMQAQLGHSRPSTTHNSYNQYMEAMQKANRDKMEQLYFGNRQENRQEKEVRKKCKRKA